MSRSRYAKDIIAALRAGAPGAAADAAEWLSRNLTDAAIHGCHHCGEGDNPSSPCWWCGLRDRQRRPQRRDRSGA